MTENRPGTLFAGPFSDRFEESFLSALRSDSASDPLRPRVILVGSNLLGIHLRHALAEKTGGHANVRFVTFVDLAERLTREEYLRAGRRDFPAEAEELLIGKLCAGLGSDSLFFDVREREGFHRALRSTFHDLVDAGVTELPKGGRKLRELSELLSEHRKRYFPRFAASADRIAESASFAERFGSRFGTDLLYCYGFYDLTVTQRRLLSALASRISLRAWVPVPERAPETTKKALRFFEGLVGPPGAVPRPELAANLHAVSVSDPYTEAEEVARWVLTAGRGRPLHRIAILLRNPDDQLPAFVEALDRARIPFYREGGKPLSETRIGRAVAAGLDLVGSDWGRTEVIRLLTSFPFREELVAAEETGTSADWDRWSREAFVSSGIEPLLTRISVLGKRDPRVRKFLKLARSYFTALTRVEVLSGWGSFGASVADWVRAFAPEDAETDAVADACFALSDLEDLGLEPDLPTARRILKKRLSNARLRAGSFEGAGLYLGSPIPVRAIPFDCVAIPGLAERSFPVPPRPDPILLDSERRKLNAERKAELPIKEARLAEETALFGLMVSQGTSALLASYPRGSASEDRQRFPSSLLVSELVRRGGKIDDRPRLSWQREVADIWLDEEDWLGSSVAARVVADRSAALRELVAWTPLAISALAWMREKVGSPSWGAYDGVIAPESEGGEVPVFSATDLSDYATCPYRFFLKQKIGLRLLVRPDGVRQLRATDRGRILHEILHRLFVDLKRSDLLPLREENRREIDQTLFRIAEEVFVDLETKLPLGPSLLWGTERAFLLSDLRALLDAEIREASNFRPEAFEVPFGTDRAGEGHRVEITVGKERLALRGRIDRIDLSPERRRARIVDYKTGDLKRQKDEMFDRGKGVQLPVYLSALPALYPEVDLAQSEAVLLSTSYGAGFRRVHFSGATLAARQTEFQTILSTVLHGVRSGLFPPFPGEGREHCRACDFSTICGRLVLRIFERKGVTGAVASLSALEEIE
ncbi:MAG: PD-(D/E)XK nuclease family protein [Pseudomonadota bacterium]